MNQTLRCEPCVRVGSILALAFAHPVFPGQQGGGDLGCTARTEAAPPLLRWVLSPPAHKVSNSLSAQIWGKTS